MYQSKKDNDLELDSPYILARSSTKDKLIPLVAPSVSVCGIPVIYMFILSQQNPRILQMELVRFLLTDV